MNLIAADIGNSSTKLIVGKTDDLQFVSDQLIFRGDEAIEVDLPSDQCFWSICSVNSLRCNQLCVWIEKNRPGDKFHIISPSEIDLKSAVANRSETGRDRLVAASMAASLADKHSPFIVIDAGTAVTVDLIRADRTFMGGVIFPGASTQLRYLSEATDALPDLVDLIHEITMEELVDGTVGDDTKSAILKGVYQSQLFGLTAIVENMMRSLKGECEVFATGGGIENLKVHFPGNWNIVPNLVLQGAFSIGTALVKTSKFGAP